MRIVAVAVVVVAAAMQVAVAPAAVVVPIRPSGERHDDWRPALIHWMEVVTPMPIFVLEQWYVTHCSTFLDWIVLSLVCILLDDDMYVCLLLRLFPPSHIIYSSHLTHASATLAMHRHTNIMITPIIHHHKNNMIVWYFRRRRWFQGRGDAQSTRCLLLITFRPPTWE